MGQCGVCGMGKCGVCGFFYYLCSCASGDRVVWKHGYTRVVHGVRPGSSIKFYYVEHFDSTVRPHRFVWTYGFTNKRKAIAAARAADEAIQRVSP